MSEDSASQNPLFEIVVLGGCLVNVLIHIWTMVLAYQFKGFWPMVLTLILPGLSELYWAYTLWDTMPYYSVIAVTVVVVFGNLKGIANAI